MQNPIAASSASGNEPIAEMGILDENVIEITFASYSIVIEDSDDGLQIRVYPITRGEIWDCPAEVFDVSKSEIETMEKDMEE